jgi:bifunctional non-homologous end joining protein LigD
MALLDYRRKRSFKKTPEPTGGKPDSQVLRFVVQKHAASHLHYDFRLEMGNVLKSWAVPKGPSMDPSVKRLAMMVEDHPYDYRTFEGIIPKGNYGAGTVIVWDEGVYHSAEGEFHNKVAEDKNLRHQLHMGKIRFVLKGKKLKGEFALIRAAGQEENSWLLMKLKDKNMVEKDILKNEKSAVSGKTLDEVAKTSTNIYDSKSGKHNTKETKSRPRKSRAETITEKDPAESRKEINDPSAADDILETAPKIPFPKTVKPMLATLVDKPFNDKGWLYEVKWDGYRALAFMNKGKVDLKSRNDKSFNDKFYPVYNALRDWNVNAIIDGEIVVLKDDGISDFGTLQNWRSEADGELAYYVFDILWHEGRDVRQIPLSRRHEILRNILPPPGIIRLSDVFDTSGIEFYKIASKMGLEGIMAKKADSIYISDFRTHEWLKIKANKRQEMVIGGYTLNKGSSKPFSALLVGVYEDDRLVYTGKVGTGFNHRQQADLLRQFKPLITDKVPFAHIPEIEKPSRFNPHPAQASATWLKPQLVCEVSYTEMTSDGLMRHPSYKGIRSDKKATEVKTERALPAEKTVQETDIRQKSKIITGVPKGDRKTLLNPKEETQVKTIKGHPIRFTNLSKIYWPEDNVTKRDLLNYYYQVAPVILPYLKDRPQSLNRFPNGIHGKSFYQKDVTGKVPEWVQTFLYHASNEEEVDKHFMVPRDESDILLMASMGCIELNPWSSRVESPDNPDWCIIDLDPDRNSFDQVIEAAQVTRKILESAGIRCYCKTSGSTGLHIYIPLGAKYTYEQSKEFARVIVTHVHQEIPEYTSIERVVSNRHGKMYLDFLQNRPQATVAAPYSLRPKPGATVSMPLHWDEVKKGMKMTDFTIFNAISRIKKTGDLFRPVLGKGIDLSGFQNEIT